MTIELIPFSSPLHPGFDLEQVHRELFAAITADHKIRITSPEEWAGRADAERAAAGTSSAARRTQGAADHTQAAAGQMRATTAQTDGAAARTQGAADLSVVLIASGGTENQFVEHWQTLPRPVYLLTDGKHNSLAASLEISAWVRARGEHCEILHGEPAEVSRRLGDLAAVERALEVLGQSRFGFIGAPSDWLIASSVDRELLRSRFGTVTEDIELSELYGYIEKASPEEARAVADEVERRSSAVLEPDREALEQAAAIYLGLKQLVADRSLTAITLRCFDLVSKYHNTGCLALALLNDHGIMAGCEGDQQALFTVVVANALTGEIPFLANPASIDTENNALEIAHCMVATRAVRAFRLRSHFETGIGVAIEGEYGPGELTIARMGRPDLSRGWASHARTEHAEHSQERCRTQLRLRLEEDVQYFLQEAVANHHVAVSGRWAERFRAFFSRLGIEND
jgi:L-fucose isomerase-like protein